MMLGRRVAAATASLAVALALGLLAPSGASAAAGDILLASRAGGAAGAKGGGASSMPSVSADARFVVFESTAANLDPADTDSSSDIYVRDTQTDITALVSRADGASGVKSNGNCTAPDISADRRYVAFRCDATNLDPADTDARADIFVRDLFASTTRLVSRASGPSGVKGNGDGAAPSISADGRVVAFESVAANLDPADTDSTSDVFVRDLQANTTTLVSRAGAKGNGASAQPSISATGRYVAFSSLSTNLPDDADGTADVFMRDVQAGTTTLVSRAATATGEKGDGDSAQPGISADGLWVAFVSTSTNLDGADSDAIADVYVRGVHSRSGTTTLISRADGVNGAKGDGDSATPTISTTGRYVAFSSVSTNLDPADGDPVSDVYSRELPSNNVRLLSRAAGVAGAKGNGESAVPAISADARFVAFASAAANLGDGDADATSDVHVRDVLGPRPPFSPPSEGTSPAPGSSGNPGSAGCPIDGAERSSAGHDDGRPGQPDTNILFGSGGRDVLQGFAGTDIFFGMRGNDVLYGFAGDDCLYGQQGNDRLSGGSGADQLFGGSGADRLRGGPGDDLLADERGRDRFYGGAGNDRIEARDRTPADRRRADVVSCGAGRRDRAIVDRADRVRRDCEKVARRRR